MKYLKDPAFKTSEEAERNERRELWWRALNAEATRNNAWVVTSPGASRVVLEMLPGSPWPAELLGRGYKLTDEPDGQRILPHAIKTEMVLSSSGAMIPAAAGSTRPTTTVITHAGIATTKRYSFPSPF
jgi:hypothetical protein